LFLLRREIEYINADIILIQEAPNDGYKDIIPSEYDVLFF